MDKKKNDLKQFLERPVDKGQIKKGDKNTIQRIEDECKNLSDWSHQNQTKLVGETTHILAGAMKMSYYFLFCAVQSVYNITME